jgi:hypothetical protein
MRPYSNTFLPGPTDPNNHPRLSLRKVQNHWHVLAVERRHCEHLHGEGFPTREEARQLLEDIRQALEAGKSLKLGRYWWSRALIAVDPEEYFEREKAA